MTAIEYIRSETQARHGMLDEALEDNIMRFVLKDPRLTASVGGFSHPCRPPCPLCDAGTVSWRWR